MTDEDVKQACVDIWQNAMALFDAVEVRGKDAVIDDMDTLLVFTKILDTVESMRAYYGRRNIQRMIALGIDPNDIANLVTTPEGQAKLKSLMEEKRRG